MIIEFEGANKVREVINRTEYLESYIPENDKTPVWDGFIMVYNNSKIPHAKKDIKGRVSVQVKGHKVEDFPDGNFKFPIELSDLKAFLTEGGAIFFVVAITQDYKKKVFHKVLLPLDIERIIQKHSDQQTVSIQFDPFPTDNGTIISIFLNFLANRSKQTSTVDSKKLFLEDWTRDNHNQTRNYTIPMTVFNDPDKTFFELITSIPQYLYITHEEFQHIQVPVDRMDNISISEDRKGSIKVDNNEHYTEYKIVWHKGNFSFHFGKGLSMNFKRVNGGDEKNGYEVNVSLNIKGTLKERIRDVEFFLSYIENEEVSINTVKFPLHINYEMDIDKINSFNEIYKSLIDIQIKLNELDVSEDLDIDMLVDEEAWKLDELVRIGDKKKVVSKNNKQSTVEKLTIANIQILLFVSRTEDEEVLLDYYTPCIHLRATNIEESSKEVDMSQYVILTKDDLTVSNFKGQNVYEDIIKYDPEEYYLNQINLFLLEVIKAYDSLKKKSEELYKLSYKVSEWLVTNSDSLYYYMNYLQVIKRIEEIPPSDVLYINNMLNDYKDDWEIYVGLLILLDRLNEAEELLSLQKVEDQNRFKNYPIHYLYKRKKSY